MSESGKSQPLAGIWIIFPEIQAEMELWNQEKEFGSGRMSGNERYIYIYTHIDIYTHI